MAVVTDGPARSIVWRTAVVIAHRLPTVPRAGAVLVFEGGDPEVDGRVQRAGRSTPITAKGSLAMKRSTVSALPFITSKALAPEGEFDGRPGTVAKIPANGRPHAVRGGTYSAPPLDASAVGAPNAGGQDGPGSGPCATISGPRRAHNSPRSGASARADWHRTA
jgi:hypothetical protein